MAYSQLVGIYWVTMMMTMTMIMIMIMIIIRLLAPALPPPSIGGSLGNPLPRLPLRLMANIIIANTMVIEMIIISITQTSLSGNLTVSTVEVIFKVILSRNLIC